MTGAAYTFGLMFLRSVSSVVLVSCLLATAAAQDLTEIKKLERAADRQVNAGHYREALPLAQKLVTVCESVCGPRDDRTIWALDRVANIDQSLGDYSHAEPLFRRILALREETRGPNHIDTAIALTNLGSCLKSMGKVARRA